MLLCLLPVLAHAAPRADVLVPARGEAARELRAFRAERAAARRDWPAFLTDTRRNARLRAQGLLTRPEARSARARTARGAAAADTTWHVLLARIGFEGNRDPALTSMAASGDFRLEPDAGVVDPPPHDANYFAAQFVAMQSYYESMSYGAFTFTSTVFPPQGAASLKLGDVADFGPGKGGQWTLEQLQNYFEKAIELLDGATAGGEFDLGNFDSIILVHPGSDLQNDINRDSPNDIPTFFITVADSVPMRVHSGLIIPETVSQDGREGGILGGLCHEFGHQLGLPDWYDTYTGLPAVGEWDLMDSGNAILIGFRDQRDPSKVHLAAGLLPGGMSAVDRFLLGWDTPYVVRAPADRVTLRPTVTSLGDGPRSALLPVSPDEYFVVENRRDQLEKTPADSTSCSYLNRDRDTGVVLWMSKDYTSVPPRLRRNSGEYDYFISAPSAPASAYHVEADSCSWLGFGLLVWHVDERVLIDGYATNSVNADDKMRALRVVEASGDYEIGDWRLPSDGFLGDGWNDPFRRDFRTELGAATVPNNWNNDWAESGWEIEDVQPAPASQPESHVLVVRAVDGIAGWPQALRGSADSLRLEPRGALVAEIDGAGSALVVADALGVYAFGSENSWRLHGGPVQPASLAYVERLAANDSSGTLAALDSAGVWLWRTRLSGGGLVPRPGFPLVVPGGAGTRLVLLDAATAGGGGVAETATGGWVGFDAAGNIVMRVDSLPEGRLADPVVGPYGAGGEPQLALVSSTQVGFVPLRPERGAAAAPRAPRSVFAAQVPHGLDAPDSLLLTAGGRLDPLSAVAQVVVLRRDGKLAVVDPARGLLPGYPDLPPDRYIGLAIADLNGDGELEILAASAGRIVGLNGRGARLLDTPIVLQDAFALRNRTHIVAGPLVADVAGDSLPEILVASDLGLVYVLDAGGKPVAGYPRKMLPDRAPAALLAASIGADPGRRQVVAVSAAAAAVVAPAGGESGRPGWVARAGNAARTGYVESAPAVLAAARLRDRERPLLAWPNPSRDGLVQLRITARRDGPYDIRIYNLEGQQVFTQQGTAHAGTQEIAWRCGGMASGVYLCRFVSSAAGVSSPLIAPITLLR